MLVRNREFFLKIYSSKAKIQGKVPGKAILRRDRYSHQAQV